MCLPIYYAMECILILYNYATQCLGFKRAHFDVRKEKLKYPDQLLRVLSLFH